MTTRQSRVDRTLGQGLPRLTQGFLQRLTTFDQVSGYVTGYQLCQQGQRTLRRTEGTGLDEHDNGPDTTTSQAAQGLSQPLVG